MRLFNEYPAIREHRMDGMTGLELESHRIDRQGYLSRRPHPYDDNPFVDRDFSEDQIEINTPPKNSPEEALAFMRSQLETVHKELKEHDELLWPFSNPPIIRNEDDIPVAVYTGEMAPSHEYRLYLAERYGKYKMTFSGIHFNYSLSEDLLRENYQSDAKAAQQGLCFREYKDLFYLKLAEKMLAYSWAVVALLAASPVADDSFYEIGRTGKGVFTGYSSMRCSESGYWNQFMPLISYQSIDEYTESIEKYLRWGFLIQARELYYPVRIKPPGKYTLEALREDGVSHIELRMVDLNPFNEEEMDIRDLKFLQLLLVWLSSIDDIKLSSQEQMVALQNYKSAAGYDWDLGKMLMPGKKAQTIREGLTDLIDDMSAFYSDDPDAVRLLAYQRQKLNARGFRYAQRVRESYGEDYLKQGIARAKEIQEAFNV